MADDVYELRVYLESAGGERWQNVLHFKADGTPDTVDPFAVAHELLTAFSESAVPQMLPCMAADASITALSCRKANNGGGPTNTLIINEAGTTEGTVGTVAAAANICMIPATGPYQRKEGHIYLAGFPSTFLVADSWTSAAITAFNNFWAVLQDGLSTTGVTWFNCIVTATSDAITDIADYVLRAKITPKKRRLRPKVG